MFYSILIGELVPVSTLTFLPIGIPPTLASFRNPQIFILEMSRKPNFLRFKNTYHRDNLIQIESALLICNISFQFIRNFNM